MANLKEISRTVTWQGSEWPETKPDRRMRLMSELDMFVNTLWPNIYGVGGAVMRQVMSGDRVFLQEVLRDTVVNLAHNPNVRGSANIFEKKARDYATQIVLESINLDYKIPEFDPEFEMNRINSSLEEFNTVSDERRLVVARGCPTRDDDRLRDTMLSFILYDTNGVIGMAHISRPFIKDRRFGDTVAETQKYAITNAGVVRYATGLIVDPESINEGVGTIDWTDSDNALTQVGRAIFNGVRGYPQIWGGDMDERWVCRIPTKDIRLIRDFIISLSNSGVKNTVSKSVITEFEDRMMSAFIINPDLFMNYSMIFGLDKIFPRMGEYAKTGLYNSEVYDIPYTQPEILAFYREIMTSEYLEDLSVLANVARYFSMLQ